jgi:hypothetical protein
MSEKVTAKDICNALIEAYKPPEWYLCFEVGNSTGTQLHRHADAVAINAYPSKGFEIRGFEIKVSKTDLQRELALGEKSDEIAQFCDYWFLVTPKGLTDSFTLPPTWGIIEYADGKLRQKKKAEWLQRANPTFGFLCAMIRGRERLNGMKRREEIDEAVSKDREYRKIYAASAERELDDLQTKLHEVFDATGIMINKWNPTDTIIDRLKAAESLDLISRNIRWLLRSAESLFDEAKEIKKAAELLMSKELDEGGEDQA